MTEIKLTRVDFRLMHGQVVTNWIQQVSADSILIINDELAADKFLAQVFLMAAPPGIKVAVRSIDKAVASFKNNVFKNKQMLVLFKSVEDAGKAFRQGFPANALQIGGLGNGTNRTMISNELSLDAKDIGILSEVAATGISVTLQVTPRDPAIPLDEAVKIFQQKATKGADQS